MHSPIRIIATTDLHGLFYDGQYTPRPAGTLAGVRDFVSDALRSDPSIPSFMVDAGDFAGGGIAVWDEVYIHDRSMELIADELSAPMLYDAMVPGNHDL
ncbi:MAG: metallophosphoesterase, partial [Duncaniella sp.]|nr:metallophosphoesterase [Duncaniella sp.]